MADFDGDGFLDLFVANYGPSALYRNDGGRRFVDVTKDAGLFFEQHATTPSWGDYDNDGRPDLYVAGFLVNDTHYPDHLFHNDGATRRRVRGSTMCCRRSSTSTTPATACSGSTSTATARWISR